MNPLRLIMRWLSALINPTLSRPADAPDRALAIADAKLRFVALPAERGVRVVDASERERIRQRERLAGRRVGRIAVRDGSVPSVLKALDEPAPLGGAP